MVGIEARQGRSIESIAREAGRSPSTVGYWVSKHGLTSTHAAKHAARGGIDRAELEALVALGTPIRAMAEQLGVSYTTVRHWLKRYELATPRAQRLASTRSARDGGSTTASCIVRCTDRRAMSAARTVGSAASPAGATPSADGDVR